MDWRIFRSRNGRPTTFPEPPPWRRFATVRPSPVPSERAYVLGEFEIEVVNAALYLRRPLLVTGLPGTGKSSLAHAVAGELDLGPVLHWPVNSRSTLQDALYRYDAIGRLQETEPGGERPYIGTFVRLGPLGTAMAPSDRPRVLLVDELDKGDVDLPNDLLTVFEEGSFEIPELARLPEEQPVIDVLTADRGARTGVERGIVRCTQFPVVVITSNGERDFPPAFLRRCVPLHLTQPDGERLRQIISVRLGEEALDGADDLIEDFLHRRAWGELATDQLLNAVFLRAGGARLADGLLDTVLHKLSGTGDAE
nr:MoxR family ATPase [Streptomyces sp. NBC_00322]